jgi:hypothetical protein
LDWQIPYTADDALLNAAIREQLELGPGFALVKDVPVGGLTEAEVCELAPRLVGFLGEPLLQGPPEATTLSWLVRDEGSVRFRIDGTYQAGVYTSKSHDQLDIHNDGAMSPYGHEVAYFALLCVGSPKTGGESVLISAPAVVQCLASDFPRDLDRLRRPFAFERSHVARAGQDPILRAPIIDDQGPRLRVRLNRQRVEMAPVLTGIPLTEQDISALDALDSVLWREELQFRYTLQPGDLLVVDDNLVIHSRESFVDDPTSGHQRCLVRVLLGRRDPS